jgi:uncharacterized protein (DUF697 family)
MSEEAKNSDAGKSAEASKIVRNYTLGSAATGLVPVPLVGSGLHVGIQILMLRKLAKLYDVEFSEQRANAIIGVLAGFSLPAAGASLLQMIPGAGPLLMFVGGITLPPASTYALGKVFIKHFESGGTFLTFDESRAKKDYDDELKEGKRVVEQSYAGIKP